jgi:hypothetical protein
VSDPEALIEQLRRSNRRWKALALAACAVLVLAALVGFVAKSRERMQAEAAMRRVNEALARANLEAPNTGLPR